jgi:prevent-host-death family protein
MGAERSKLGRLVGWARPAYCGADPSEWCGGTNLLLVKVLPPRVIVHGNLRVSPYLAILIAMRRTVSIAEAKNDLPALVHEAEDHPVVIERRGKRVAVLLSARAYDQLTGVGGDLWSAVRRFRKTHDVESLDLGGVFENVRNRSSGRDFEW